MPAHAQLHPAARGVPMLREPPRVTVSALARAWSPLRDSGSFLVRARAPFARWHYAAEFEGFNTFVRGFSLVSQRCLRADESQAMADDAVLLGLLDAAPIPRANDSRPNFYDIAFGYRRCNAEPIFREWLVIHERRLRVSGAGTH